VADVTRFHAVVSEATTGELEAARLRPRVLRLDVRVVGDRQEPAVFVIDGDEKGSGPRLPEPIDGTLTLRHPGSEVDVDEDAQPVSEGARTTPTDAERIACATVCPVRGDHVGGTQRNVLPGHDRVGCHPVAVLGEADDLGRKPHIGVSLGTFPQHRLQALL
jgi:hypothetical protein